ncbi:MAG: formate dehydrogenase subunit alpha [Bryobacteraceae bacterium]
MRVSVDGKPVEMTEPASILDAIRAAGVEMPTLCHDDRVSPCGSCRMCLVQVGDDPRAVASCVTAARDGMEVRTHAPEIEAERRAVLGVLAERYPAHAAAEWPDKPLHRWMRHYGIEAKGADAKADTSHPYIAVDMSRCIYCYRCVRICAELQGQFVWNVRNRADRTRIVAGRDQPLSESNCVSCGACVDTCPTGALEDKLLAERPLVVEWTRTTCPYCGTGCEMLAGSAGGRLVSAKPVPDAPVSKGHLCVKGRYAFDFVHAQDRVTHPMIRHGGEWQAVGWEEAVDFVARELTRIRGSRGADSIGVLGSARATNEENYVTQKFARVALGTNNVDCCARVCHAPTAAAMNAMLGTGAATNSFDDIERAACIFVFGANPTENHPVVGARIRQAALRGAKLIVGDPRATELAGMADVWLPVRPGTNVAVLNAMAHVIVEEGLFDPAFVDERVCDWPAFRDFIREWTPERVERECGIAADRVREAARVYAAAKPAMMIHGLGVTEHGQGTEGVMCLVNLALLTGNFGKPGAGVNPLRGQNNVQGSAHMGCEPEHLAGYATLDAGREVAERVWGAPVPATRGKNMMSMMDAAGRGDLAALWTIGYDVLLTNADAAATRHALGQLELVIVQDLFLNETAREFGTVFLPAASSFEKDGTFMNAERRVQRVRKSIAPVGDSRSDWEIVCAVARAMGVSGFEFRSAEQIWNEVRSLWKAGAGMSYERLERGGLQWPCPSEDHPGTAILHERTFPSGPRAALRSIPWRPPAEAVSAEFPLLLTTGRTLFQFNAGTMTMRTANAAFRPSDTLDLCAEDARALGIGGGERVRVTSRYGSAELPARITEAVARGQAFATFHCTKVFLNEVTGPYRDSWTAAPEYKVTAVRVEKAGLKSRAG